MLMRVALSRVVIVPMAGAGQKVYGERQGKRLKKTSLLLAQCQSQRFSPMLFEGTCDSQLFNTWLEQCLIPELKPGQTVVMDNAPIHKSQRTVELLEAANCHVLFLPPYSPRR